MHEYYIGWLRVLIEVQDTRIRDLERRLAGEPVESFTYLRDSENGV